MKRDRYTIAIMSSSGRRRMRTFSLSIGSLISSLVFLVVCGTLLLGFGSLATWKVYKKQKLQEFYRQDSRYAIFIHQAVLSGVILSSIPTEELQEFSTDYNYPVHLHSEDVTENRPEGLEDLVTCRHEGFHVDPNWEKKIPAGDHPKQWIASHLV